MINCPCNKEICCKTKYGIEYYEHTEDNSSCDMLNRNVPYDIISEKVDKEDLRIMYAHFDSDSAFKILKKELRTKSVEKLKLALVKYQKIILIDTLFSILMDIYGANLYKNLNYLKINNTPNIGVCAASNKMLDIEKEELKQIENEKIKDVSNVLKTNVDSGKEKVSLLKNLLKGRYYK